MLEAGTLLSLGLGPQPTGSISPSAARLVPWTKSRRVICRSMPSSRSVFFIYLGRILRHRTINSATTATMTSRRSAITLARPTWSDRFSISDQ